MTEEILETITSLIGSLVPLNLSEAETEEYPYASYEAPVNPVMDKDGVCVFSSNVVISVYAKDFDTANTKAGLIKSAIESGMHDDQFSSRLVSENATRVDGIWDVELIYSIKQYN